MSDYTELHFTSKDGLRLYARDYPSCGGRARLPVVCIRGLTRNSADFEDIAPVLAGDVRGRGNSAYDPDPRRYNPLTYATDVLALARLDVRSGTPLTRRPRRRARRFVAGCR